MLRKELRLEPVEDRVCFFALSMLMGCVLYFAAWFEPSFFYLTLAGGVTGIIAAIPRYFDITRPAQLGIILVCGMVFGLYVSKLATLRTDTISATTPTQPILLEGWLERIEPGQKGPRLRIRTHAVSGLDRTEMPQHVRLTHRAQLRVEPGRFVRCWVVLRAPPRPVIVGDYAFHRQAWFEGLGAVGYVQGRCRGGALGADADLWERVGDQVNIWRRAIARYVNAQAGARAGGFAAALASGDRSFMSIADQEALRSAGLAHLMAISGLHMGIVGGLIYVLVWRGLALIEPIALRVSVRKPAAFIALCMCFGYLVLSGASVATQRAFVMALVFFGAVLMDRTALSLRSFAIAMIAVLSLAPWSALTPGFQMSFAATGALIVTYQEWRKRHAAIGYPRRNGAVFWTQSLIVTSLVSSFATLPFALYHFERYAELGIVANLLAMPIISLVSAPLAMVVFISAPFGLSDVPLRLFGASLESVLYIAETLGADLQGRAVFASKVPDVSVLLWAGSLIILCLLRPIRLSLGLALSIALLGYGAWRWDKGAQIHWAPNGVLYAATSGQVRASKLRDADGLAPLRFKDMEVQRSCQDEVDCAVPLGGGDQVGVYVRSTTHLNCAQVAQYAYILAESNIAHCPKAVTRTVTWPTVVAQNGVSLVRRRGVYQRVEKRPCGHRPWEPCSDVKS